MPFVHKTHAPLQDDVLERLQGLMFGLRARFHAQLREAAETAGALTPTEVRVLRYVAHHPGLTQAELVAHSRRDKAQVTRLIQQLEAQGLLARTADEEDRRRWRLSLTPRGQALQQSLQAQHKRLSARLVHDLTPEELRQLGSLLARMQANLDAD